MSESEVGIPYFDELLKLMGSDEEIRQAFGKDVHWGYWEDPKMADGSVESFVAASEALTRKTISHAPLRNGIRILDVGCGFGGTIHLLNETVENCELVGINIEERQLARARSQVTPKNGNTIEFLRMDANELHFEETFDVIFAVECIFHFDRPKFFHLLKRHLKQDGRFVITDFVVNRWKSCLFSIVEKLSHGATVATYGDIDLSYSVRRYRQVAAAVGLECSLDEDITRNTLPTYEFVLRQIAKMEDPVRVENFTKATEGLEKVSRWGILGYHVLAFSHTGATTGSS